MKKNGTIRSSVDSADFTEGQRALLKLYDSFVLIGDQLYFINNLNEVSNYKLVLPGNQVDEVIDFTHSNVLSGHLGGKSTKEKMFL